MFNILSTAIVLLHLFKLTQAQTPPQCQQLCTPLDVKDVLVEHPHCFNVIYVFGDSLDDTGNLAALAPTFPPKPYGVTNPGCPKGRFSDGALLVDYIAQALGLPTTRPFLACPCGTNFAFAGATARDIEFYPNRIVNVSLSNETEWFFDYRSECPPKMVQKSLAVIGGGGNDYVVEATLRGQEPSEIIKIVPLVVARILEQVQIALKFAKTVLVLNIPQTSCTPLYLELFGNEELNRYGCPIDYGRIVDAHNALLRKAIRRLNLPTGFSVVLADRFKFLYDVLESPGRYGIVNTDDACCGGGGEHNAAVDCGPSSNLCSNPSEYVFFDRVHFTDNFNRQEALAFISTRNYLMSNCGEMLSLLDLCKL